MKHKYPELVRNLTSNPFPDALEVTPDKAENVDKLYQSIVLPHMPPGVDKVQRRQTRVAPRSSRSRT